MNGWLFAAMLVGGWAIIGGVITLCFLFPQTMFLITVAVVVLGMSLLAERRRR